MWIWSIAYGGCIDAALIRLTRQLKLFGLLKKSAFESRISMLHKRGGGYVSTEGNLLLAHVDMFCERIRSTKNFRTAFQRTFVLRLLMRLLMASDECQFDDFS